MYELEASDITSSDLCNCYPTSAQTCANHLDSSLLFILPHAHHFCDEEPRRYLIGTGGEWC